MIVKSTAAATTPSTGTTIRSNNPSGLSPLFIVPPPLPMSLRHPGFRGAAIDALTKLLRRLGDLGAKRGKRSSAVDATGRFHLVAPGFLKPGGLCLDLCNELRVRRDDRHAGIA